MRRTLVLTALTLLCSPWAAADGALPPRLELQKLTAGYVHCRALVGEQGSPGLLVTPDLSDQFCPAVVKPLLDAGIRVSGTSDAVLPQVRAWVDIVRNPTMPGIVAVGVHVGFSDVVRLTRLPKVSPVEQGELWRRDSVGLIAEERLLLYITQELAGGSQVFVADARCVNDRRCRADLE